MKKKNSDSNLSKGQLQEKPPKRYQFYLGSRERYIVIDSDFDSGNIEFVRQISEFQYRLSSVRDGTFTDHQVNSKSWFYFSVTGFPAHTKGKFLISRVQTLQSIYYSKYKKCYRPVYKVEGGQWKRIPTETQLVMRENGQLECVFDFLFRNPEEKVFFAFCYPFSYKQHLDYMQSLSQFICIEEFYFYKEILVKSVQGRDIHLLTITSHDHLDKNYESEELFDPDLFPEKVRPSRFKKPVIFISARVHPGETPASFAMKGVIDFLVSKNDLRANLLRKMFVFMIVPMINVDGVAHGHFRMDVYGKNLNRFYIKPDAEKQPAIYAIKQLADHLNQDNRLCFYFDLHAHNAKKGCFIYGNAINDFVEQVQSQVFCKLIAINSRSFEYEYCNFTQKHMKAKDNGEDLTKEGCGRVVMYRNAKIIHSYSLECGILAANKLNVVPEAPNEDFTLNGKGFIADRCEDNNSSIYQGQKEESIYFTPEMYQNVGKNLIVSVLDVFDKNPFNRVYNSKYKNMDMLRRLTAFEIFHEAERFRMFERFIFGKVKNINELIRQVLNTKLHYKKLYNFYFYDDKQLKNAVWPMEIPGFSKPKMPESPTKLRRFKSSEVSSNFEKEYSESFVKALMSANKDEQKEEEKGSVKEQAKERKEQTNQIKSIVEADNEASNDSQSSETEDYQPPEQRMEYMNSLELMIDDPNAGHKALDLQDWDRKKCTTSRNQQEIQSSNLKIEELFNDTQLNSEKVGWQGEIELTRRQLSVTESSTHPQQPEVSLKNQGSHSQSNPKIKQSPSVRIRKLPRQDGNTNEIDQDTIQNNEQLEKQEKRELEPDKHKYTELKTNIYESIKREIKEELQRQRQKSLKKAQACRATNRVNYSHTGKSRKEVSAGTRKELSSGACKEVSVVSAGNSSKDPKISSQVKIHQERIKSWNMKNRTAIELADCIQTSNSKKALQLPIIGSQMYVICTSTKTVVKKN